MSCGVRGREREKHKTAKRIVNGSEEIPMRKFDLNKFYAKDKFFFLVLCFVLIEMGNLGMLTLGAIQSKRF